MYFILLGLGEKQGERKKEKEKTLDIGKERAGERERESVVYFTCFLARFYAKMTNYDSKIITFVSYYQRLVGRKMLV